MASILVQAGQLVAGNIVERFPYAGPEKLPVVVACKHRARAKGSLIIEGTDAEGNRVLVPVGHYSNFVRIQKQDGL